jgi:uncharacterized protein (TIGR03790 family)
MPLFFCLLALRTWAGGSGLNVIVVVNQNSTNSVQLGNYYCEKRQVPPQNYLRINWPGGNTAWTNSDFQTYLYDPLISMLSSRQLTNQAEYVVLSMDIPYHVFKTIGDDTNSTTSALFYGFHTNDPSQIPTNLPASCSLPVASSNSYAGSEGIFRSTPPINAKSNSFLVTMITATNLALAKQVVDQGVASDGTFPTQVVYLAKSDDTARNIRYQSADNAVFDTRLRGNYSMQRIVAYGISGFGNILGFQSGAPNYGVAGVTFVPGGMADNLTSFGGQIFQGAYGQLNILSFLQAGAVGTYGTVDEPCAYLEKFPSPQNYFYQSRGFSLAECYYQSVTNPYQGLLLGEPLTAPFQQAPSVTWSNLPSGSLLSGVTNLTLQAVASDISHPVQQVDLFVDGLWTQTLTNITPRVGNLLYVTLNGFRTNYAIGSSDTNLTSVVSNLILRLNRSVYSNMTKVAAISHGDRIGLQSVDPTKSGSQLSLAVSNSIGAGSALTTFLSASSINFLDSIAWGLRQFTVAGTVVPGDYLQLTATKTNGANVTVSVTNTATGVTLDQFIQQFMNTINATASLQGDDGLEAEDLTQATTVSWNFNLRARGPGFYAAQMQALVLGSFVITPAGSQSLNENISNLQPRAHLYVTAGLTNLPLTFSFNTSNQQDGFHELTAVAYEGSHVRTQERVAQIVKIQNSSLSAVFTPLVGDTNTALEATLQFSVVANTNNISRIELFSTGGSLGSVVSQSNAIFSVAGSSLGLGLHPFYAIVTATTGKQYRTETKWIRLVGSDAPFTVTITTPPPSLAWPAAAGRSYDVLSAASVTGSYQLSATVVPTNSAAQWTDAIPATQRFYRVRTSN